MTQGEIAEFRRTLSELRQCVGALRSRYGDAPAVRRLVNDVERLNIDVEEFEGSGSDRVAPPRTPADRSEVVVVPDTPYDPSLWEDADDEGVGGYHGKRL
ncbi:hypothetical protein H0B56_08990 [Haloechinothrix sp. YIM 98757]|uniref:Uncharacterized protein n=1 Tax=Haloechinothrix aidingensis TaxID=2752311 RepID=A0A838A9W6_9PSEU|nr:hypothetical protein [Haloechinothrix aidingensis]MBA0125672.1 hypothetical protein [Haloechinothrix aidingensis]